jgi:hypothetical protein
MIVDSYDFLTAAYRFVTFDILSVTDHAYQFTRFPMTWPSRRMRSSRWPQRVIARRAWLDCVSRL